MEIRVHELEPHRLVPGAGSWIVSRPRLEADDATRLCEPLRLAQQLCRHALSLVLGMHREVPDHSADTGPLLAHSPGQLLAFGVDEPDDLAAAIRHELDRVMLVVLLGLANVVEERRVEERQNPTDEPTALIFVSIWADHDLDIHLGHPTKHG